MKLEPAAANRVLADMTWQQFQAFHQTGFTRDEAYELTKIWLDRTAGGANK